MQTENAQKGITLSDVLGIVKSHLIAIIAIVVVFFAAGMGYAKMQKPVYKSQASVTTNYDSTKYSTNGQTVISTEFTLAYYIIPTIMDIFKEDTVLSLASENLQKELENGNLDAGDAISVSALSSNLSLSHDDEKSLIIKVYYKASTPKNSQIILSYILDAALEVLNSVTEDGEPVYKILNNNIKIFSPASVGEVATNSSKRVVVFTLLGIICACVYVFIREYFSNRFKTSADVENVLGLPVLSVVPEYDFLNEDKSERGAKV